MDSPIVIAAQALAGLLRAAEEDGLPMPPSVEAVAWPPFDHPQFEAEGGIDLHVTSLAALAEWAIWLGEPIDDTSEPYKGAVTNRVFGMAGPVPVKVWTRVPVAAAVS